MLNPFICGPPVFGDNFINRETLLIKMNNLIRSSSGNILIFGIRRIGKTSLCLHLSKTIAKDANVLIGYLLFKAWNRDYLFNQFCWRSFRELHYPYTQNNTLTYYLIFKAHNYLTGVMAGSFDYLSLHEALKELHQNPLKRI